jgi:DNA-directed RNA polymerase specialized sigma24 family protein
LNLGTANLAVVGRPTSAGAGRIPVPAECRSDGWRVHRALEELPEHQRALIELAYWSELSQFDIATRLNISLGTLKTRTRTALADLADLLGLESP